MKPLDRNTAASKQETALSLKAMFVLPAEMAA